MTDNRNIPPLVLPALRGYMGDRHFYTACMKMADLAERVELASVIHKSERLSNLIQREVAEGHAKNIEQYLIKTSERFFNAIVIGVYGGTPEWIELSVDSTSEYSDVIEDELEGIVGYLRLSGKEELFAIDGQHRVVGIKRALETSQDLGKEEVTAIFIAHKKDEAGERRTRRLFTTLNRYAKPIAPLEKVALDEDDVIAITTRRLMEDCDLLRDRLSIAKQKAIPRSDNTSVTTVVALYEALDFYLKPTNPRKWADFKRKRPEDNDLEEYYQRAVNLWDAVHTHVPAFQDYTSSAPDSTPYRHSKGGHLLFRAIGVDIIFRVVRHLMTGGLNLEQAVKSVASVPMQLGEEPWVGVLWNPVGRMTTGSVNQRIAIALLLHKAGGNLSLVKMTEAKLQEEIAGLKGN